MIERDWWRDSTDSTAAEPTDTFTLNSLVGPQWLTEQTEPDEDTFDDEDLPSFEINGWDV